MEKDTRTRLIAAATPLFADKGFAAVSIRELAREAGVNVAAISYHFGGKEALYQAVLDEQFEPLGQLLRQSEKFLALPPEERLGGYAENIAGIHQKRPYFVQFMHREMTSPTSCLKTVVKKYIEPMYQFLYQALQEGVGTGRFRADLDLGLAVLSLVGIMNFYFIGRQVVKEVLPLADSSAQSYTRQAFTIFLDGVRRENHE